MTEIGSVKIKKLVYGGEGLGHFEGQTVFVPFVLPDEVVDVIPQEQKKRFVRGRVARIVEASPLRIPAPCPHFGICGGCDYQHIPYEKQLDLKADILRETLSRLGKIRWEGPIPQHRSPAFGYRNRTQWKIAGSTRGGAEIGYYEARSQTLHATDDCPILSPYLASILQTLSRLLKEGKLPATLREVEAFADHEDARSLLNLSFEKAAGAIAPLAELLRAEIPGVESILLHDVKADQFDLSGPGYLSYRVGEDTYQIGHLSFFQVNRFLLGDLVSAVLGEAKGQLALDLFAGAGLFTLPLSRRFERVIGVESNVAAARDLENNLHGTGATSTAARHSSVEAFLARWHDRPDFVVLDPPRAGVQAAALASLNKLGPRTIVYLSCDPATLARDLGVLAGTEEKPGPYQVSEVHLVDIFPQTYHMEALVRLLRRA